MAWRWREGMGVAGGVLKLRGEAEGVFPLSPTVFGGAFLSSDLRRRLEAGRKGMDPSPPCGPELPTSVLTALLELVARTLPPSLLGSRQYPLSRTPECRPVLTSS